MEGMDQNPEKDVKDAEFVEEIKEDRPIHAGSAQDQYREKIDIDLLELKNLLLQGRGYMIGLTIIDGKRELHHTLSTFNFPNIDMLKSGKRVRDLIIEHLENNV